MFPRELFDGFLKEYSDEEKELIQLDLEIGKKMAFHKKSPATPSDQPVYLATAGAPGAAKSTTL
ncbi:MAG TPA: hypothetical protein VHA13_03065 [Gammaproteobacteria bacterium]|nr:hypothetical protein [Gammaproteobacteria bacterium]